MIFMEIYGLATKVRTENDSRDIQTHFMICINLNVCVCVCVCKLMLYQNHLYKF